MRISILLPLLLLATLTLTADGELSGEGYILEPLEVLDRIPVADSAFIRHRGLPSSVDLAPHFPVPGSQGNQGSCVGWATTYALKTYHEKRKRNWDLGAPPQSGGNGEHVFSPAWTYNQINGGRDRGAHIPHALELLISKGAAPWSAMPYNVKDYRSQPSAEARRIAAQYRAKGYEQVPIHNVDALKAELARGNPMAIGVYTGPDRRACCRNGDIFDHFTTGKYAGHAMVLVGYDDRKVSPLGHRGALKLMEPARAIPKKPREHHLRQWYVIADLLDRSGEIIEARRYFSLVAQVDAEFADVVQRHRPHRDLLGGRPGQRPDHRQRADEILLAEFRVAALAAGPRRRPQCRLADQRLQVGHHESRCASGDFVQLQAVRRHTAQQHLQ